MAAKPVITVEVASKTNGGLHFGPVGERLRGRWTAANVARQSMHESLSRLSEIPVIPGIRLVVDMQKGECRLYDPLRETEEGQKIWEAAQVVLKHWKGRLAPVGSEPWPMRVYKADADMIKDWLYWIRRAVDSGAAEVVTNESTAQLPTLEQIKSLPGKRVTSHHAANPLRPEDKFADVVPVGAGAVGAGAEK